MDNIEIKLKFKTISSVILSPRVEKALYKGIDFKSIKNDDKTKMIYPFYSYCDRELDADKDYSKDDIDYYIPASSLKGALLCENKTEEKSIRSKILVKDINRLKDNIKLDNLYKFQYLYKEDKKVEEYKVPKLEVFFPNIKIEMLKNGAEFNGEILLKGISKEDFIKKVKATSDSTKKKLEQYIAEVQKRLSEMSKWEQLAQGSKKFETTKSNLKAIKDNLKLIENEENKYIFFLGGYKGVLGSISELPKEELRNGFYIDKEVNLPYGLVEVEL
jgi:hypothetical protein